MMAHASILTENFSGIRRDRSYRSFSRLTVPGRISEDHLAKVPNDLYYQVQARQTRLELDAEGRVGL